MLTAGRREPSDHLPCVVANFGHDGGRSDAGCECVLHVASPPTGAPWQEDEPIAIVPAREGTRRALVKEGRRTGA